MVFVRRFRETTGQPAVTVADRARVLHPPPHLPPGTHLLPLAETDSKNLDGADARWSDLPEGILLKVFEMLFQEENGRQLVRRAASPPLTNIE